MTAKRQSAICFNNTSAVTSPSFWASRLCQKVHKNASFVRCYVVRVACNVAHVGWIRDMQPFSHFVAADRNAKERSTSRAYQLYSWLRAAESLKCMVPFVRSLLNIILFIKTLLKLLQKSETAKYSYHLQGSKCSSLHFGP